MIPVRWLWLPLALLSVLMIIWGVRLERHVAVRQHAQALCTACIGLE